MPNPKNATFDAELHLEDGDAAVTATGVGQVGGSDKVYKVVPDDGIGTSGQGPEVKYDWLTDVEAVDNGDADETYELVLQGSADEAFTTPVELERITVDRDTGVGRYSRPGTNQEKAVVYPFVRVRHVLGGTTPSLTYNSRLVKRG